MKMTISIGKKRGGLYKLAGVGRLQSKSNHVFLVAKETSNRKKIIFLFKMFISSVIYRYFNF